MITCSQCQHILPKELINTGDFVDCPKCRAKFRAVIFPALFRPDAPVLAGETSILEQGTTCFYHTEKKAVVLCSSCGRFLCALCDIEFNQQHLCPQCLQSGAKKKKIRNIENECMRYDQVAFGLAVYPLVFIFMVFFTLITAPMALFISIRHWKKPASILTNSKGYLIAAMIISTLQIIAWIVILISAFYDKH